MECKGSYLTYCCYYKPEMSRKVSQEQSILNEMESALEEEQFEVYLQPKYNLRDDVPYGAEALIRWNHPDKGILSPGIFIPIFERNGFIGKTDTYMWEHEFRKPRKRFAVFFVDLDDFKKINDTYGHIEGDRLLRKIGAVLKSVCRKDDIVCRFGGDEFLILIKDLSGEDTAARKAEQILAALQNLSGREKYAISCSIGICYVAEGRGEIESYIRKADQALYAAKNKGKNHFELLFC